MNEIIKKYIERMFSIKSLFKGGQKMLTADQEAISTDRFVEPLKGMNGRSFISIDELRCVKVNLDCFQHYWILFHDLISMSTHYL